MFAYEPLFERFPMKKTKSKDIKSQMPMHCAHTDLLKPWEMRGNPLNPKRMDRGTLPCMPKSSGKAVGVGPLWFPRAPASSSPAMEPVMARPQCDVRHAASNTKKRLWRAQKKASRIGATMAGCARALGGLPARRIVLSCISWALTKCLVPRPQTVKALN
jgi:hypothetical protein